ncbi:TonB family protein [Ideonella sp. B508-1]|uniref:TonB family protein n=1 Tax=Ideonella sp. B508-1 TaxID=137716 RepID=UPI000344A557|nr:TonB family protein [Ideonella sp. B508-1]
MNTRSRPSRPGFAPWLGVSLLLHGALLGLPWLWFAARSVPPPPRHQLLVLDLAGLVGTRQLEAATGAPTAHPPAPPPAAPRPAPAPTPAPRHAPPAPPMAGVAALPAPAPAPVAPEVARPRPEPAPEVAPPGTADDPRPAQTLLAPRPPDEAAAIQQYLRALRQAIQSRLVYPPEARALGAVGAPVIRFAITATGDIQPGSLSIQESSGYPVLDDKALAAALASAPLARPPKPMKVAIAVSFTREP